MIYSIKNDFLTVRINSYGAELTEITDADGTEYLCRQDRRNWNGIAPVLFPNTGAVHESGVLIGNKKYRYIQHGFAKNSEFSAADHSNESITFVLSSGAYTHTISPYDFSLAITYTLSGSTLRVSSAITNTGKQERMYCALGFHPGFACPLEENEKAEDYSLHFDSPMTADRMTLENGLVAGLIRKYWDSVTEIPVQEGMFDGGSFSMTALTTKTVSLISGRTGRSVTLCFDDYPNLVLWAPKNEKITNICIEPWYGRPDDIFGTRDISLKKNMLAIDPMETKELAFSIAFRQPNAR